MRKLISLLTLAAALGAGAALAQAPAKKTYDVCWSHYTGWEPWAYADEKGLLKKWGDKYGIAIRLTLVNDYVESVNLYTAGKYQACAMTNMDVLTIPAAALNGTNGAYAVQVLGANGAAEVRQVTVGLVTSTLVEVKSGLSAGEAVITGTAADRAATTPNQGGGFGGPAGGGGAFPGGGGRFVAP